MKPRLPMFLKKLKRGGPAVLLPKDIGLIIVYTEINKESVVVDAGAGSGFLAIAIGRIAKKVTSYEVNEAFAKLAEENAKRERLENVEVKRKDIFNGIDENNIDVVTLDLKNSHKAVVCAHAALKKGGYVVGFLPNIEQAREFYSETKRYFEDVWMCECIEREYVVGQGTRPAHKGLMHTGYVVFGRK